MSPDVPGNIITANPGLPSFYLSKKLNKGIVQVIAALNGFPLSGSLPSGDYARKKMQIRQG
jgi:hypothetical protein